MISNNLLKMPPAVRGALFDQVVKLVHEGRCDDARRHLIKVGVEPGFVEEYVRSAALIKTTFASLHHAPLWRLRPRQSPNLKPIDLPMPTPVKSNVIHLFDPRLN